MRPRVRRRPPSAARTSSSILHRSDARKSYNEGCLSIPEQYAEIERPDLIRLKWLDEQGRDREGEFDGLMSVCLQHEVDHLDGVLFIDYLSRLKRDMIVKRVVKARGTRGTAAL
jgi:peptide deformylase